MKAPMMTVTFNKTMMTLLILVSVNLFFVKEIKAETISCGLKRIDVQNGKINRIEHEDGTVHTGNSINDNWSYDGKSIKHRLIDEPIACGTKPKTRSEIIGELSSKFNKNPSLYGMNKQEAQWMSKYTLNLMKSDKNCHLLVDGAKSINRNEMFYIDCNNSSGQSSRFWVSREDLKNGISRQKTSAINGKEAVRICDDALRSQTINPASYKSALLTGASNRISKENGRNSVEIEFTAKNGLGSEGKYIGKCILESGHLIEVIANER